ERDGDPTTPGRVSRTLRQSSPARRRTGLGPVSGRSLEPADDFARAVPVEGIKPSTVVRTCRLRALAPAPFSQHIAPGKDQRWSRTMKAGIVGLPNVGKSTLFNALTSSKAAQSANYPFCTIEPNEGIVSVPDDRLRRISTYIVPKKLVPTALKLVDIA